MDERQLDVPTVDDSEVADRRGDLPEKHEGQLDVPMVDDAEVADQRGEPPEQLATQAMR